MLEVQGLGLSYRRGWWKPAEHVVLRDVSFQLSSGECLGITAPSGAGKTTLARCLIRLIEPSAGSIRFDGLDVCALPGQALRQLRRRMQVVFQNAASSFHPAFTVRHFLAEPFQVAHRPVPDPRPLLAQVDIAAEHLDRLAVRLSGGQRQRLLIARALSLQPTVIIADEPTASLDDDRVQLVTELLAAYMRNGGALLLLTHDTTTLQALATRRLLLNDGQLRY